MNIKKLLNPDWYELRARMGRRAVIGIPFIWLLVFFLIPFAIVLKISFAYTEIAIPPYSSLFDYADEALTIVLNLGNYLWLADDPLYISAYMGSVEIAFIGTVWCLLVGYPMAYAMAKAPKNWQSALLMAVLLPSWTSFLIRIYAWMGILRNNGLLNNLLMWLGVIDEPLVILNTNVAVYIGIVYAYLPFMVLPLYSNLVKMDKSLIEAAQDLGAKPFECFYKITLPLSMSGIIAGSMLVFIPAVGEVVIPQLLGGPETLMIGKILWQEFFNNRDWPVASALAIVMLLVLLIPIMIFNHSRQKDLEGRS
ncbi:ABC transporter permease subunit [Parendozoicomonas haliclonae]|uniref:Putrescine transport system permease protein PotH n=1 Tax=Parendozoicomonas haliclonae TaxID=1960125 RepID=A0A1X7AQE0_9GAMM|nr:ABC transporter permease subunit [Parendozoicomonas haliclonae]SMA50332.1 Putrescine transport system permease protein PotH [Parendozoicomonas haliclonae]